MVGIAVDTAAGTVADCGVDSPGVNTSCARQRCQDDAGEDYPSRPSVLVGGLFERLGNCVVAVTGRLIDVQRLEQVVDRPERSSRSMP